LWAERGGQVGPFQVALDLDADDLFRELVPALIDGLWDVVTHGGGSRGRRVAGLIAGWPRT
jgi:hypothetical protein